MSAFWHPTLDPVNLQILEPDHLNRSPTLKRCEPDLPSNADQHWSPFGVSLCGLLRLRPAEPSFETLGIRAFPLAEPWDHFVTSSPQFGFQWSHSGLTASGSSPGSCLGYGPDCIHGGRHKKRGIEVVANVIARVCCRCCCYCT